jgi:hypothetical protein
MSAWRASGRSGHQWHLWTEAAPKGWSLTGPLRLLSPLCPLTLPRQPLDASNNRLIVFNVHLHGKHSAFIKLSDFPNGPPCFPARPNSERGAKKERCCTTVG